MGLERYVVDAVLLEKRGVSEVATAHGISRFWLYKLLARFREGGYAALEPRSRRPHGCAHAATPEVQAAVVRWRHQLAAAGHDCGASDSSRPCGERAGSVRPPQARRSCPGSSGAQHRGPRLREPDG